jgi:hypothetical protein
MKWDSQGQFISFRESLKFVELSHRVPGTSRIARRIHEFEAIVTRTEKLPGSDCIRKKGELEVDGIDRGVAMTVSGRKPHTTELAGESTKK